MTERRPGRATALQDTEIQPAIAVSHGTREPDEPKYHNGDPRQPRLQHLCSASLWRALQRAVWGARRAARGVRITDIPLLPRLDSCELTRGMLKTIHPQPPAQTPSPGLSQARPQPCQSHFSRSARNHPGMKKASIAEAVFAHVGSAETACRRSRDRLACKPVPEDQEVFLRKPWLAPGRLGAKPLAARLSSTLS